MAPFAFLCVLATSMTVTSVASEKEIPTQLSTPFIAEPQSPFSITENATQVFVWQIVDCDPDWQVRIVSENYMLYPNLLPGQVPIKINSDYNVTETCEDGRKIVNLSINFNENVLENFEYVTCKIFNDSESDTTLYPPIASRVDFTKMPPPLTFNSELTIVTTHDSISSASMDSMETTTGSGCNLSVHLAVLALGIFVADSAISWIS